MANENTLQGICPIVATPFTRKGKIDENGLRSLVNTLCQGGCHGAILFGVAGEFYKLSDEERRSLIQIASDELTDEKMPLLVSITHQSASIAVDEAKFAQKEGVDGLMVLPPSMLKPGPTQQYDHIKAIAESVDLPIMVQYAPETAGSPVPLDVFVSLAEEFSNVRYFKIESEPPGPDVTELVDRTPKHVGVFVGYAGINMIEAFDRGATGVIPGSSLHDIYLEIHRRYRSGDREGALALHDRLVPFLNHVRQGPPMLVHYEKKILKRRGVIDSGHARQPAFEPDDIYDNLFEYHYGQLEEYLMDI